MTASERSEVVAKGLAVYERIRPLVETPENIGKMVMIDPETGDYELQWPDDPPHAEGLRAARSLKSRHPGARLYGHRVGYQAATSFAGGLRRADP